MNKKVVIVVVVLAVIGVAIAFNFDSIKDLFKESVNESEKGSVDLEELHEIQAMEARDVHRIGDLELLALTLEQYYSQHGNYPVDSVIGDGCDAFFTIKEAFEYVSPDIYEDPINSGEYTYKYESDGKDYVFSAHLENSHDKALEQDIDGVVLGCLCDDPIFCIQKSDLFKKLEE